MSDENDTRGVHVSSGEGIVAHLSNLTAYAKGDETRLNELLVRLNALKDAPWHEVVRTLTAGIVESNYDEHPDLACVSIADDRVAALVFGDTTLSVTTDRHESVLNGRDSSTWIDVAVHGTVERVLAGSQSSSVIVGVLRDGVIPAGGFLLDTAGPMPSSTRWVDGDSIDVDRHVEESGAATTDSVEANAPRTPTPSPPPLPTPEPQRPLAGMFARLDQRHREDSAFEPDEVQDAAASETETDADTSSTEDVPTPPAIENNGSAPSIPSPPTSDPSPAAHGTSTLAPHRPQLRGVLCPNGHLTQINDGYCRSCSEVIDRDAEVVLGDRPVLGSLTFDDGAVLAIDRPAAIGADVPAGYVIDGEPATVVRLDDGLDGISPVQVEIRTVSWDVEIHDMNSANGTYTILRGERQTRTRLRAGQSVVLQDGMMVEVGGRSFTFSLGPVDGDVS